MDTGESSTIWAVLLSNKTFRRSRANSASEFMDSPGKKYPRLCVLLLALSLFCFISWLPFLSEKPRGPLAFVWPHNQSRSARHLILPEETTSILTSSVCSHSAPPYLLVIVCSAVQNFEARYSIRQSWASDQHALNKVKVVFLVGQRINETLQVRCVGQTNSVNLITTGQAE